MHRCLVPTAVVAIVSIVGACSSDGSTGAPTAEVAAFCAEWNAAYASGDDDAVFDALAAAPDEIAEEAAVARETDMDVLGSAEAEAAVAVVLDWTELNCPDLQAGESARHVAPPVDATFGGLVFCSTVVLPRSPAGDDSGMVLYGDGAAADPYDGPMIGVVWNAVDGADHGGDGDSEPVTVRGHAGVAAPISVFQQTVLPELGTVVAWTEGDRSFGVYGRGWSFDRAGELVEIANRLEEAEARFRLPDDALPAGFAEIFSGDPSVTSVLFPPSRLYWLRYQGDDGILDVNGLQMTEAEFEAFRFFTTGVDRAEVAGRDGLAGNAWHADGPAVVTWREPDGLVVRIVGLGVPRAVVEQVAERARELSDDEWAALVETEDRCEDQ